MMLALAQEFRIRFGSVKLSRPDPQIPPNAAGRLGKGYGGAYRSLPLYAPPYPARSARRIYTGDASYTRDLARIEHPAILNYGVAKEQTSDGLPWLVALVRSVHPSTVVILEGINDLWGGRSASDIAGNLSRVAKSCRAFGALPIILTVLPVDRPVFLGAASKVRALDAAIRVMAKQQDVQIVAAAARFRSRHPLSMLFRHSDGREDGVHPNDAGYRLLAKLAARGLNSR
jgi:lysophospholipase L1-like esterase